MKRLPRLVRADGVTFAFEADGRLKVEGRLGASEVRVAPALLPVVAAFSGPRTAANAARDLGGERQKVLRPIERLERAGILVPAPAAGPRGRGDGRPPRRAAGAPASPGALASPGFLATPASPGALADP